MLLTVRKTFPLNGSDVIYVCILYTCELKMQVFLDMVLLPSYIIIIIFTDIL